MGPRPAQVPQDRGVCAARLFESVGQQGEAGRIEVAAGKDALRVCGLGEGHDGRRLAGGFTGYGVERVAEEIADQRYVGGLFTQLGRMTASPRA